MALKISNPDSVGVNISQGSYEELNQTLFPDPSILGIPCTYGNIPQRDCSTNELCYLDWMSDTGHCASS